MSETKTHGCVSGDMTVAWINLLTSKAKVQFKEARSDLTHVQDSYTEEIHFYFWKGGICREAMLRRNGAVSNKDSRIELLVRDPRQFWATSLFPTDVFIEWSDEE